MWLKTIYPIVTGQDLIKSIHVVSPKQLSTQFLTSLFIKCLFMYLAPSENWWLRPGTLLIIYCFLSSSQVKGGFTRGYRVFELSARIDGWPPLSVPACRANLRYTFYFTRCLKHLTLNTFDSIGFVQLNSLNPFLSRAFKPEVSGWLPRLSMQVAGFTILRM